MINMIKIINKIFQLLRRICFNFSSLILISTLSSQITTINIDIDLSSNLFNQRTNWNKPINPDNIINTVYIDLNYISRGEWKFGYDIESVPIRPTAGCYDYYYRCVVVSGELINHIILEKICSTDIDANNLILTNQLAVPIWSYIEGIDANIYNTTNHTIYSIDSIKWIGKTIFTFNLEGLKIVCNILE